MRIALVTSEYPGLVGGSGGLAAYVRRTAIALRDQDHEPVVFAPGPADDAATDQGIVVHAVATRLPGLLRVSDALTLHRGTVPLSLLYAAHCLEGRLRTVHRDIPFAVAHYAGINGLGMFRSSLPAVARASCHRHSWTALGDGSPSGWHAWLQAQVENAALRLMDLVFAPSRRIADLMAQDLGRPVSVLANPWIATAEADVPIPAALHGASVILFAGTLSRLKGAETLGQAMRTLTAERSDLCLAIAGRRTADGDAALAGLGGRIVDLGLLGRPALHAAMRSAAAVVVPSLIDNLPNVAIEAMAAGAPMVASSGLGLEEIGDGDGPAAYVQPGDPAALAAAIRGCLDLDDDSRARIAARARAAIATLAPERTIPPLVALYQQAIAMRSRR